MSHLNKNLLGAIIGMMLFIMPNISTAQETDSVTTKPHSWDRLSVSFGGFLASYNSGITFGSKQLGVGVLIDIEQALGLESSQFAMRGSAKYNFGNTLKHSITLGYFGIFRNAKKVLEEELDLGGEVFPIGTEITSTFDLAIIRTKYDYAFFQDERVSLGASFGLFIMPVSFTVIAFNNQDQSTNFIAPLPLIGLRSDFKINEKFHLNQSVEVLYLSVSNITGSLLDLNVALEHKTFDHIAFGVGINSNRLNLNIKNPDSPISFFGDIRMDYTGILFYAKYYL